MHTQGRTQIGTQTALLYHCLKFPVHVYMSEFVVVCVSPPACQTVSLPACLSGLSVWSDPLSKEYLGAGNSYREKRGNTVKAKRQKVNVRNKAHGLGQWRLWLNTENVPACKSLAMCRGARYRYKISLSEGFQLPIWTFTGVPD